jgi:hypothetical protein
MPIHVSREGSEVKVHQIDGAFGTVIRVPAEELDGLVADLISARDRIFVHLSPVVDLGPEQLQLPGFEDHLTR